MNAHQLHDAFGELPEELVDSVARARGRKKVVWGPWAAVAACACLALVLSWQLLPAFQAHSKAPESGKFNGLADKMEAPAYSAADSATDKAETVRLVQVVQVEDGGILVSVLPEQKIAEGTQIRIAVNMQQETYVAGDRLRIYCDGQLQETWPLQLGQLYGIERVEAP